MEAGTDETSTGGLVGVAGMIGEAGSNLINNKTPVPLKKKKKSPDINDPSNLFEGSYDAISNLLHKPRNATYVNDLGLTLYCNY